MWLPSHVFSDYQYLSCQASMTFPVTVVSLLSYYDLFGAKRLFGLVYSFFVKPQRPYRSGRGGKKEYGGKLGRGIL
jgi:hypothetical protein